MFVCQGWMAAQPRPLPHCLPQGTRAPATGNETGWGLCGPPVQLLAASLLRAAQGPCLPKTQANCGMPSKTASHATLQHARWGLPTPGLKCHQGIDCRIFNSLPGDPVSTPVLAIWGLFCDFYKKWLVDLLTFYHADAHIKSTIFSCVQCTPE